MNRLESALLHAAPVAVTALYGAWWIALHTGGGRASAHTLWQSLALTETLNGIQATAAITAAAPASRVQILTTFDLDEYVFAGLKAGASGFLLKDAPPADLLTAIRTVAGGEAVLAPTATRRLIDQFVPLLPDPGQQPDRYALLSRLTDREQAVFTRLAAGLSNREIADQMHLSQGTVKIHVGRILDRACAEQYHAEPKALTSSAAGRSSAHSRSARPGGREARPRSRQRQQRWRYGCESALTEAE